MKEPLILNTEACRSLLTMMDVSLESRRRFCNQIIVNDNLAVNGINDVKFSVAKLTADITSREK